MAKRYILGLALTVLAGGVISALALNRPAAGFLDPQVGPSQLIKLHDGRRINLRCVGAGRTTVVFEGGFGATSGGWYKVLPMVAKHHRACVYDRASSGFSDPGPLPRDGAAIARDLDETLRLAHISGPLILVGHSAGGLYVRLLSDMRPNDVVGMVLVDPSVEYQDQRLADYFGPGAGSLAGQRDRAMRCLKAAEAGTLPSLDPALVACAPKPTAALRPDVYQAQLAEARRPDKWRAQISELDSLWKETSDQVHSGRRSYGAMPLAVLTAGASYANSPPKVRAIIEPLWARLHREVADRSTRGSARLIADSTHMMIFDRPDAIAVAIDDVAKASRIKP